MAFVYRGVRAIRSAGSGLVLSLALLLVFCSFQVLASPVRSEASDVLIVADTRLKPVSDLVDDIRKSAAFDFKLVSVTEVMERGIDSLVADSRSRVVLALGQDAALACSGLSETIPLIYGMTINRLSLERANVTGIYMATPVSEYSTMMSEYFPALKRIGVVCEPDTCKELRTAAGTQGLEVRPAKNSYEFVREIENLKGSVDAMLLLPERNLITTKALQRAFLLSFSENIPLIGISEKYVKQGSFMALVFDISDMGRQISRLTEKILARGSAIGIPAASPERYSLYLNSKTAEHMKINVPVSVLKQAERVYQ